MQDATAAATEQNGPTGPVPTAMPAAVYRGPGRIAVETVPVPEISEGEILVRVRACGICGTDLKKIEHGLVPPPRIFGHELAGTVVRVGSRVEHFQPGDRVAVHHHVPCRDCYFCDQRLYSQCAHYRRTGTTAGFEPAGGGFAQYVRVMDWVVQDGTILIPDGVSCEEASFLEPLNTCLRALETAELQPGERAVVIGQGPVGLMLSRAASLEGAAVIGLDLIDGRLDFAREMGADLTLNPARDDVAEAVTAVTQGRGADLAIVAAADPATVDLAQQIVRRGGRVLLFAQTVPGESIPVDVSRICMEEKKLIGSYSSSIDLQQKSADWIFTGKMPVARLISHRIPLDQVAEGIRLASRPSEHSLKVIVEP